MTWNRNKWVDVKSSLGWWIWQGQGLGNAKLSLGLIPDSLLRDPSWWYSEDQRGYLELHPDQKP